MNLITIAKAIFVVALNVTLVNVSHAQNEGPAGAQSEQASHSTKAQRKEARKQARAKKNAELKKLEDAGYNPAKGNDPHYPQDLQSAQKKAGVAGAASQ
ncbi:purine nucleoside phosphorylase [Caballeronia telluris]|uniref:Purine nucleoside phosphorylase n=1 Tax=Caballeronia telluris TaxID=326475 RepID=A0A158KC70_9BURK|nr:purine nucleoside phosphorylase [Caballeronia telluris]